MRNCTVLVALLVFLLGTASVAQAGAIVYESFNYTDTGGSNELNGQTADSGLGAWAATAQGRFNIKSPGKTYTDANSNVLPVQGNYVELSGKSPDAHARADILTTGWSGASVDGGRLNKKGATIWWSTIVNQIDGKYGYTYLELRSDDGGRIGLRPDWHGSSWANPWKMRGINDDGTSQETTFGVSGDTERFLLMKLDTDATSGDTTFSIWANPLIDSESSLGAAHGQLIVPANSDGSVTHFDELYMGHTSTHGEQMRVDEIRMGETFNSVVGLSDAGIEVTGTAGTWNITREENSVPEVLEVDKRAVDLDPFDMEITVTGGSTTITIDETVLNETMEDWTDYHVQLGTGLGIDFVASTPGDGLSFISGTSSTFPALTWLSEDELAFSGSIVGPLNSDILQLQLQLPGDDPYTFTLRQWPTTTTVIPEPSTFLIWALGLLGLVLCARRRRR